MAKDIGIIFADISGTTRLHRKIGTAEAKHQLERYVKRMERAIESFKGRVAQAPVDEMVATFESADDAVSAAIETQRRLQELPPLSGVRLSIRVGVHFGSVEEGSGRLSGSAVDVGRALLNLAGVDQIVTCAQTAEALSKLLRDSLYSMDGMSLSMPDGNQQVYQVAWQSEPIRQSAVMLTGSSASGGLKLPMRLALRWDGKAYLVDASTSQMQIGRDRECDLRMQGSKVSRKHARIEMRPKEGFVLVDESSNGTYLFVDGVGESRLHNEEAALHGHGRIAFGHTTGKDDGEVVDFELS